ncbi:hypothetical protein PHJA_002764000 [Phtheirospermum japonicum]|uniref:Uncharacterized protein n=1 Tax=Phtheirospermum japonicum TaxID=374723 RepID=A0A830D4I6_9LAMI|nr:hypothetical protein PHJA_002764000 [Phtheirospermum japonicum]
MDGRIYEPKHQHLLDLQDNSGFGSDPKSWLSGDDLSRTLSSLSAAAATASATGNVDRVLFNDLVEMVPLVQSLIDRKANSSFTRRGSMIFTKTPSRESLCKKTCTSYLKSIFELKGHVEKFSHLPAFTTWWGQFLLAEVDDEFFAISIDWQKLHEKLERAPQSVEADASTRICLEAAEASASI